MKKNKDKAVTTVRLPPEAEALLLAELDYRQKTDPSVTKTEILVECVWEYLSALSPERALSALVALAGKNPLLVHAMSLIKSAPGDSDTKLGQLTEMLISAIAEGQRDPGSQPPSEVHEQSSSARPKSKKKPKSR